MMVQMPLAAAIEHGTSGRWYGRIMSMPGSHARADSREGLLRELVFEVEYHVKWLRRHREPIQLPSNISLRVSEEINGIIELGNSGGEVALFSFDLQLVDSEFLEKILRYMRYNRSDLMSTVTGLDEMTFNNVPVGKGRSIREILTHVCNAEEFYISRMGPEADRAYERHLGMEVNLCDKLPVFERMPVVRRACIEVLREIVPQNQGQLFQRVEYTNHPKEQWTAYKVLRRFLEHEREHFYNIREYLDLEPRSS